MKKIAFLLLGTLLSGIALADICPTSGQLTFDPSDSKLKYKDTQKGITWVSDNKVDADTSGTLQKTYIVNIEDTRLSCSYSADWKGYINVRPYSSEDIKNNPFSDPADKGYISDSSQEWGRVVTPDHTVERCYAIIDGHTCGFNSPAN